MEDKKTEITKYDCEGIVSFYHSLNNMCLQIDSSILNMGTAYSYNFIDSDAEYVIENILDSIERKNKYINLKIFFDRGMSKLKTKYRQVLLLKTHYQKMSMQEICGILNLKERTLFRRIEKGYEELSEILNADKDKQRFVQLLNNDIKLKKIITDVSQRRKAYKGKGDK